MNFFKRFLGKKGKVNNPKEFWTWFQQNEQSFFEMIKERKDLSPFFDQLSEKLDQLHSDTYYFLTGMCQENRAELVLTAEGAVKNVVFVEELVAAAPQLAHWKFTALKPASNIDDVGLSMNGLEFTKEKLSFYPIDYAAYPDEIEIAVVHEDCTVANEKNIAIGSFLFLDNYLGELNFISIIDHTKIVSPEKAKEDLIPIYKLKDYLNWRQKEFLERYDANRTISDNDNYSIYEGSSNEDLPFISTINKDLLEWDEKASYPWILVVNIAYEDVDRNGLPSREDLDMLNQLEDEMESEFKKYKGYLHVGRETGALTRKLFFACKDFRLPSKLAYQQQQIYATHFDIEYSVYKDKYWRTFNRYQKDI